MTAPVALESTIYAFGLPEDEAFALGLTLTHAVQEEGGTPVPIAVMGGEPVYGFSQDMLRTICRGQNIEKANARDLGALMATQKSGATTVSGTCVLAARKGIQVFATGGIGGVHRGSEETFDESMDLMAIKENPVAVVSAGAKSILDLPKTLERLETLGVPVWGYQTETFPEFYHRGRDLQLEWTFNDMPSLAAALKAHWEISPNTGVLICNPIPAAHELPPAQVDQWLAQALRRAKEHQITGKRLTPFLLNALKELSKGQTVTANLALIENNARMAAQLAVALKRV
ncbi:MAG: pseudouridine-5-phosphate glycosidase [Myxococcales bacterium]|nr:pseudouridine-5-phosphate glycosidase [Myxococcales bacterium]